jgi:hypothetical protein
MTDIENKKKASDQETKIALEQLKQIVASELRRLLDIKKIDCRFVGDNRKLVAEIQEFGRRIAQKKKEFDRLPKRLIDNGGLQCMQPLPGKIGCWDGYYLPENVFKRKPDKVYACENHMLCMRDDPHFELPAIQKSQHYWIVYLVDPDSQ